MSDAGYRSLGRTSENLESEVRALRNQVRAMGLDEERITLAAQLGDEASQAYEAERGRSIEPLQQGFEDTNEGNDAFKDWLKSIGAFLKKESEESAEFTREAAYRVAMAISWGLLDLEEVHQSSRSVLALLEDVIFRPELVSDDQKKNLQDLVEKIEDHSHEQIPNSSQLQNVMNLIIKEGKVSVDFLVYTVFVHFREGKGIYPMGGITPQLQALKRTQAHRENRIGYQNLANRMVAELVPWLKGERSALDQRCEERERQRQAEVNEEETADLIEGINKVRKRMDENIGFEEDEGSKDL